MGTAAASPSSSASGAHPSVRPSVRRNYSVHPFLRAFCLPSAADGAAGYYGNGVRHSNGKSQDRETKSLGYGNQSSEDSAAIGSHPEIVNKVPFSTIALLLQTRRSLGAAQPPIVSEVELCKSTPPVPPPDPMQEAAISGTSPALLDSAASTFLSAREGGCLLLLPVARSLNY